MLYLLDKDVKTVKWNGIPLHEASSAIVKEETNGDFYLTVHYPITDSGVYQLIKEDMLIKAPVPVLGAQLFRIKKPVENDDSLDITAYHITDDVMQRSINPVSVVGQSCAMALSQMVQNAKTGLGDFSFTSDIMDSRTFNTTETETLYSVLMDGKHSIVGTWEGELVRDNFALTIKQSRGADSGVVITTHKNLKSYQRTKNSQNVVTRIHARSTFRAEGAETDTVLTVTVDSPLIGNYPYINEKEYENNDVKTIDELKKLAEAKFKNEGIDKVSDAIEIEAYELDGQVVHLGDTVNIKSSKHSVDIYKKAIAYEYNALTEEYISITFDDKPGVGGSGVSSGLSNVADVILSANRNAQEVAIERAVKNANQAFDAEFDKRVEVINDGIEQAKSEAEAYADNIKQNIDTEIAQVNQSMQAQSEEHDRQVADILSKTQSVEELANQAKTDAATVSQALNTAKTDLQNQVNAIDAKAIKVQSDANALRTDLNQQAQTLLSQAQAQTALTNRVSTVETLADGTSSTVAELSKTVSKATSDITSVTSRTKTVEDTLSQTRTQYEALTQTVNTQTGQIDSINRKTADLQSGIDGVKERFNSLQVGGENLFLNAGFEGAIDSSERFTVGGVTYVNKKIPHYNNLYNSGIPNPTTSYHAMYKESFNGKGPVIEFNESDGSRNWKAFSTILQTSDLNFGNYTFSADIYATGIGTNIRFGFYYFNKSGIRNFHAGQTTLNITTINSWHRASGAIKLNNDIDFTKEVNFYIYAYNFTSNSILYLTKPQLEEGTVATAFSLAQKTIRSEIAEYKRTADQNYAGLQLTVSTLDGKVTQNKSEQVQTADAIKSRLNSLETYKDAEGTRSQAYFEASKTETAKQITAERTAISANYVAKSTYDENVLGTTLKLNEVKATADTAKQNLATYQETVDRKLTELTSSTQTLDGKINTASTKVDTVAGQIRTEISETKALIPTSAGGRNYLLNSKTEISGGWSNKAISLSQELLDNLSKIKTVTISCDVEGRNLAEFNNRKRFGLACSVEINGVVNYWEVWQTEDTTKKRISHTFTVPEGKIITKFYSPALWIQAEGNIKVSNPKVEFGALSTDWSPAPEDLATVTALHSVRDTVDSHTRTIGAVGTSGSILDNVSQVTQTANGLVQEVSGANGLKTQVSTLAGSYAIKNLTNSGTVLNQLNLNKDGTVKIDGKLVQITGTTYIQDGVISSAKIANLDAGKITTGTLNAALIAVNSIDGSKLVFDQAFVNKMTANEALFKQLFAQSAFITQVQAVTLSASKISGGVLKALNNAMEINMNAGQFLYYTDNAALKRILSGYPTQFVKFATGTVTGKGSAGVTVIGSNRYGTESSNDGGFVGIRAWNGSNIDSIDVVGDSVRLASSAYDSADGWNVVTLPNKLEIGAYNSNDRASSKVKIGDVWLWKNSTTYSSMRETINLIIDNLQLLHNNKTTEKAYSYTMPPKV